MNKPTAHNRQGTTAKPAELKSAAPKKVDGTPDDYELKLDEQVGHFLGINHTLSYFMITAAVGTFGFTINLLIANKLLNGSNLWGIVGVVIAALASLLGAASSLIALRCDIRSYRLHLKYRHERKKFVDLSPKEQANWDELNSRANSTREVSFILLIVTVLAQFVLIIFLFIQKRESNIIPSVFSSFFQ